MAFDLVAQGERIDDAAIAGLARSSGSTRWRRIAPGAARFHDARPGPGLDDLCARLELDCALVQDDVRLSDYGLVAMDMDSTLITIECIDELADMAGIRPQVAKITASAMRGEIDFAESLTRRTALLAGLHESALERVWSERLTLSPGAERLIEGLRARGIRTLLVSGGFTFFTERLKARLGLDYALSNEPEIADGRLTGRILGRILDARGKAEAVRGIRESLGLAAGQVIAIGDGANDLAMLAEAGVSIAYHAKPVVRRKTTYSFNHVGLDGLLNLFP